MLTIAVFLATARGSQAAGQDGVHRLTGSAGSLSVGEQAELCGRPVVVSCKDGSARIMMDVGVEQILMIEPPASAVPELLEQFDARYLRREVCATGTYSQFARANGITVSGLSALSIRGDADFAVAPFKTPAASPCESGITLPTVVAHVEPRYTRAAMQEKIQGVVLIEAIVEVDGAITEARVLRSLDAKFGLDDEALKAAKQWRFHPSTRDGVAVPLRVTIEERFSLR